MRPRLVKRAVEETLARFPNAISQTERDNVLRLRMPPAGWQGTYCELVEYNRRLSLLATTLDWDDVARLTPDLLQAVHERILRDSP